METKYWIVDNSVGNLVEYPQVIEAAELLKGNEVVAFPTETVYGLGGNAENDEAVEKIFQAKGRPSDNPLIIHIAQPTQLKDFVESIPNKASKLMDAFWPGPLTIIFQKKEGSLSDRATAGLKTVAVRIPDHPVALAVLESCQLPIAAPSANTSGKPSPTTGQHVLEDLKGKVCGIVDGGATGVGVESTVIDCTEDIPVILRPGGVTKEQIEAIVGVVKMDEALTDIAKAPKSPGMKYQHYAPNAPLFLVKGSQVFFNQLIEEKRAEGLSVGVLTTEEMVGAYEADVVLACGRRAHLETVASQLYQTLRTFNERQVDIIYSEMFPYTGVGQAIMNRLEKAAGHRVISE
ncbi:L-threonylcarbamoyladenylate synthase [Bacillus sp. CGMCC 1.16607]|uniref:L-threonylcarbamoyladenylate synthase n=1 Tax=Bacillus sp. CGMCC 1.16607 TaxID=3351842 RepID=UPI003643B3FF